MIRELIFFLMRMSDGFEMEKEHEAAGRVMAVTRMVVGSEAAGRSRVFVWWVAVVGDRWVRG